MGVKCAPVAGSQSNAQGVARPAEFTTDNSSEADFLQMIKWYRTGAPEWTEGFQKVYNRWAVSGVQAPGSAQSVHTWSLPLHVSGLGFQARPGVPYAGMLFS